MILWKRNIYTNQRCVTIQLCEFNLKSYINKKINKIGIIFNTHPHTKEGEHWVALFIDLNISIICYFDSEVNPIPKEIKKLIQKIKSQANTLGLKLKFVENKIEHQQKNTECGMYSIHFILSLLHNNMNSTLTKRISDDEIEKKRFIYFSKE